jgi:hypothetical protein
MVLDRLDCKIVVDEKETTLRALLAEQRILLEHHVAHGRAVRYDLGYATTDDAPSKQETFYARLADGSPFAWQLEEHVYLAALGLLYAEVA